MWRTWLVKRNGFCQQKMLFPSMLKYISFMKFLRRDANWDYSYTIYILSCATSLGASMYGGVRTWVEDLQAWMNRAAGWSLQPMWCANLKWNSIFNCSICQESVVICWNWGFQILEVSKPVKSLLSLPLNDTCFWMFWPVIQLTNHLSKSDKTVGQKGFLSDS